MKELAQTPQIAKHKFTSIPKTLELCVFTLSQEMIKLNQRSNLKPQLLSNELIAVQSILKSLCDAQPTIDKMRTELDGLKFDDWSDAQLQAFIVETSGDYLKAKDKYAKHNDSKKPNAVLGEAYQRLAEKISENPIEPTNIFEEAIEEVLASEPLEEEDND